MRPVIRVRTFCDAIKAEHLTTVVDVGANPFAGSPPYGVLRRSDRSKVIGFEPLPAAFEALMRDARSNDTFLPYAIGDGTVQTLYITKNSGLVSTLKPLAEIGLLLGPWWQKATQVESSLQIETKRLDDIEEIQQIDFLKIDIQGGELEVFKNARNKLSTCAVIQTEVCIHPYYEGQPSFGEIQTELSAQGFIAHKFVEISAHPIASDIDTPKKITGSQATVADVVFIKDPTRSSDMSDEMLKQMAILSMSVFHSYDLTLRCLSELRNRDVLTEADLTQAVGCLAA